MKKTMAIAFAAVSIGCLAGTPKNGAGRSSGVSMEIVLPEKPNVSVSTSNSFIYIIVWGII